MASQLEIQAEINKLIAARAKMIKEQSALLKGQVKLANDLCEAMRCESAKDTKDSVNKMSDALDAASEAAQRTSEANQKMAESVAKNLVKTHKPIKTAKSLVSELGKQFPIAAAAAAGFIDGVVSGFSFLVNNLKSVIGLAVEVGKGIFSIGVSIASIPFKMLDGLIAVSNRLTESMFAVAQATEEVRKQFGDLTTGAGRSVMDMARGLTGNLEGMGSTAYRVFGNMQERIQFVAETAKGMGATFEVFQNEMKGPALQAIMLMQKGLGLTGEDMGSIAQRAKSMGTTLTKELKDITKFAVGFGKRFGISSKNISRDVGMMIKDVKNFGNLGPKVLSQVSVYARKLGIDVKDLLGVIDKFDTFEDAAVASAKLSQAFGANIDAVKMMAEQDPTKRIDMMRKAFFAAGNSAEKMSRQELKLLAQTTGLDEKTARAAFSMKNMGVGMAELEKQGKVGEKQQISQQEAILKLSDAIERMVKPLGQFKGFLQAFADGFARGVFAQEGFRSMLTTLNRSLAATKFAGIEVGKAFSSAFPGVADLVKIFKDLIKTGVDPVTKKLRPFSKMLEGIKDAFKELFGTIGKDGNAVKTFLGSLETTFDEFFGSINKDKIIEHASSFAQGMGNMMAGLLRAVATGLTKAVDMLVDFITNPKIPDSPGGKIASKFIDPISKEFAAGGAVEKIGNALGKLFNALWPKVEPYVLKFAGLAAAVIFGAGFIKMATTAASIAIGQAIAGSLSGVSLGGITTALSGFGATLSAVVFNPLVWIPAAAVAIGAASVGVSKGMKKFRCSLEKEFGETESMVGAATAGIVDMLSFGFVPDSLVKQIGKFAASATKSVMDVVRMLPFGDLLADGWSEMIESTIEMVSSFGDLITTVFSGDSGQIKNAAQDFGGKFVKFLIEKIVLLPVLLKGTLYSAVLALGGLLIKGLIWTVTDGFAIFGEVLMKSIDGIFQAIAGVFFAAKDWIKDIPILGALLEPVLGFVGTLFETIGDVFGFAASGFEELQKLWPIFGQSIADFGSEMWSSVTGWATKTWDSLMEKIFGKSEEGGESFIMGIDKALRNWPEKMAYWAKASWETVKNFFGVSSPSTMFMDLGINMMQGLIAGFKNMGGAVIEGFKSTVSGLGDVLSNAGEGALNMFKGVFGVNSPSTEAATIGQNIIQGMMNSLGGMPALIQDVAEKGLTGIEGAFTGNLVGDAFKGFTSPITDVIKGIVEEANAINDALGKGGAIDIDARLKELANGLGIDGQQFEIKHKDFKVIINLNVTMESDKVADAVVATKKVMATGA